MKNNKSFLLLLITVVSLFLCLEIQAQYKKREMRGVWIATVANIDWPSEKGNTEAQKKELLLMLDSLRKTNINTIIFQARPASDAFYQSTLEPWSAYLTGEQGKAPYAFYDPLAFLIEEAHKRCMEVHVWINPYRVTNTENTKGLVKNHIYYKKPYLFKKYGGKYLFDPGLPETRDYLIAVVSDIVVRYDVDAIHLDDYFYPYKVAGKDFPDGDTFHQYSRGIYDKEEWRRDNVNLVISRLYKTIKSLKPWVEFGISPFGVWRNNTDDIRGSATAASCTNYDELYADVLQWLQEGWVDYITPQLYWEIGKQVADYSILATWWSEYNYGKKLYIGLYASGLEINAPKAWKTPNELIRQLSYNQDCSEIQGAMFYSARYFLKNIQGLQDSLRNSYYKYPALPPFNENNAEKSSAPSNLRLVRGNLTASLFWDKVKETGGKQIAYYVVYKFSQKGIGSIEDPANIISITVDNKLDIMQYTDSFNENSTFAVTAVNRFRQESEPAVLISK